MNTAQMKDARTSTLAEETRCQIIDEIRAVLPRISREQKEILLERLQALAGDIATTKEAAD